MIHHDGTNYYEILEVPPDAPQTEIHKAYQRAKVTYSQDNPALYSMFTRDEARELLKLIEEAYSVLGNQALRKSYDESLYRNGGAPPATSSKATGLSGAGSKSPASQSTGSHSASKVASDHKALPDFKGPDAASFETTSAPSTPAAATSHSGATSVSDSFTVKRKESKPALPAGTARTPLSTYKIDEAFDAEIASMENYDGAALQKIRLYRNVSLDSLSESTRISRPYLMALETNDYKNLPAAVFVRGFVVQVARLLCLNEAKVAASYMKLFKAGGGK